MWYQSLAIDRIIEEQFRNRDLSSAESEFMRLIRMGILDGREGYDFPMTASSLSMRHSSAVSMRLWVMLVAKKERVGFLVARAIKLLLIRNLSRLIVWKGSSVNRRSI